MRESNFAFPAQNRASVCISSQLYDRRALDTNSSLPLFNSLTHLVYLTSTSPRIREIMTMDGGLERLVRILHEFCLSPPPAENPAILYGLLPHTFHPSKPAPVLNPKSFDKHAAYRFSLAFQCVVNIGVRGSEPIRSRVVQAGTLEVVGCILEAWLVNKGFALGPSSSATGMPRETREQRAARRQAMADQRNREQQAQAEELARALERQQLERQRRELARVEMTRISRRRPPREDDTIEIAADASMLSLPSSPSPATDTDADTSTDTSTNHTPAGSNTPTGTVEVPGRDRSGTIIARPVWDVASTTRRIHRPRERQGTVSGSTSRNTSRPETEKEDDVDIDMDQDSRHTSDASPEPILRPVQTSPLARRAVGIVSDGPGNASLELNSDAHIIINHDQDIGGEGVGVPEGIVSLEPNDDFAMGAPPGAPGAIEPARTIRPPDVPPTVRRVRGTDATPRAGTANLPFNEGTENTPMRPHAPLQRNTPLPAVGRNVANVDLTGGNLPRGTGNGSTHSHSHHRHSHHHDDSGPYRDEDVLLSLQLLAYLSKYPHVRQAFYNQRTSFHPASDTAARLGERARPAPAPSSSTASTTGKESTSFFKAFTSRGKEKERAPPEPAPVLNPPPRLTNVFSLVERFTFRPNVTETEMANPPPILPQEIQYWAGVIMRNACRKDESRGGIRQCANMLCGRWETYPREFAKCRRCRKAKYCGKECQSTAWSEGHRFWCSAKEGDDEVEHFVGEGAMMSGRSERRDRERVRERVIATTAATVNPTEVARAVAHAYRTTDREPRAVARPGPVDAAPEAGPANPQDEAWQQQQGWGRAIYEASPFGINPNGDPSVLVSGRRRAETMPGGMVPVVDSPVRLPPPRPERSRFFNQQHADEIPAIAGPSRGLASRRPDEGFYGAEGDYMDVD
ncbi:hypothetical protein OF83DRAFT_1177890 [Amylostereum chailletii]|nr:hypothetical protein OF83DRAFT_1177890 [Amylostereum chailletii]